MNVEYYRVTFNPQNAASDRPRTSLLVAVEAGLMGSLHFPSNVEVAAVPAEEDIGPQQEDLTYGWGQFLDSGNDVEALWKLLPHLPEARMHVQTLEEKYARLDREGEHPVFPFDAWQAAAAKGATASWYWLWVKEQIAGVVDAHYHQPLSRVLPHAGGALPATPMAYTGFLAGFGPYRGDSNDRRMVLTVDSDLHASMPIIEKLVKGMLKQDPIFAAGEADSAGLRVHLRSGYRVTVESDVRGKQETTSLNTGSLWWCYRALESAIELQILNCDRRLLIPELEARYDPDSAGIGHPLFKRSDWVEAIKTQQTLEGYWEWASNRIADRLRRLEPQASADSPAP